MPINPKLLVWARESVGLTKEDAAKKLSFELEKLEMLENGEEQPSYTQLKKFGMVYKRSTGVFFLDEVPVEPAPPKDFRVLSERASAKLAPSTLVAIRSVHRRRSQAIELALASELKTLSFKSSINLSDDVEAAGLSWREAFRISSKTKFSDEYDALRTWKSAIEELGVLVFQESLESLEELRGLAIYEPVFPAIMLNSKDTVRGRIFSLLHEFCHLLLKTSGIGNMSISARTKSTESSIEVFCNAFAGACLVPTDLLLADPAVMRSSKQKPISGSDVQRLSNRFQASGEVILRRLLTLGKITQSDYEKHRENIEEFFRKKKQVSKKPVIIPVPTKAIARNGRPYTELVLSSLHSGILTDARAAKYLGVGPRHISGIQKAASEYRGE